MNHHLSSSVLKVCLQIEFSDWEVVQVVYKRLVEWMWFEHFVKWVEHNTMIAFTSGWVSRAGTTCMI